MKLSAEILEARSAIADLVNTYALHIRAGNPAKCAPLFTTEAVFETRMGSVGSSSRTLNTIAGRDAIIAHITNAMQSGARLCPMIHNLLIEVNGPNASSNCVMAALALQGGTELVGEYVDTYRLDGVWRFTSRTYTILLERRFTEANARPET